MKSHKNSKNGEDGFGWIAVSSSNLVQFVILTKTECQVLQKRFFGFKEAFEIEWMAYIYERRVTLFWQQNQKTPQPVNIKADVSKVLW